MNKPWTIEQGLIEELHSNCKGIVSNFTQLLIFDYANKMVRLGCNPNCNSEDGWTSEYSCYIMNIDSVVANFKDVLSCDKIDEKAVIDAIKAFKKDTLDTEYEENYYKPHFDCSKYGSIFTNEWKYFNKDAQLDYINSICVKMYYAELYHDEKTYEMLWRKYINSAVCFDFNDYTVSYAYNYGYSYFKSGVYTVCAKDIYLNYIHNIAPKATLYRIEQIERIADDYMIAEMKRNNIPTNAY